MPKRIYISITRISLYCSLLCPMLVLAQQRKLKGLVFDRQQHSPLSETTLILLPDNKVNRSDARGAFQFDKLYDGQYQLEVQRMGYRTQHLTVNLAGRDTSLTIHLDPTPQHIETVNVQGKISAVDNLIQAENAAMPVKVITRREIELMGSRRLDEVMKEQTGVAVVNDVSGGARAIGVQIQGFSSNYVMVLIDGQPMMGRNNGNFDLSRISVTNIERIEIIKGASSCLYGSDALGGAINIITRHGAIQPQAQASLLYGSLNIVDATVEAETPFHNKRGSAVFSGNYYRTDGYNTDKNYLSGGTTVQPYDNYSFQGRVRYRTSKEGTIGLTTRYAERSSTMLNQWSEALQLRDKQKDQDLNLALHYDHQFSSTLRSMSRYYFTHYQTEMQAEWIRQSALASAERFGQQVHRLEQQFSYTPYKALKFIGGLGGSLERMNNDDLGTNRSLNSAFAYLQNEWQPTDRLHATLGLRYDYSNVYNGHLSPSFGLQYRISNNLSAKGGVGAGFKAPDYKMRYQVFFNPAANYMLVGTDRVREVIQAMDNNGELSYKNSYMLNLVANNLKAEKSLSNNVGLVWNSTDKKVQAEFSAFYHRISNQINSISVGVGTQVGQIYSYRNLPKAVNKGFEVSASWQATKDLELSGGYQYLIAKDMAVIDSIRANKYPYNQLINNPATGESRPVTTKDYWGIEDRSRHMVNLKALYSYQPWGMNFNLRANVRGKYPFQEINGNQFIDQYDAFVPDHVLLNLTIEKSLMKRRLTLRLIADNLLDYTHRYMPGQPGRVILGGLSYRWIKD